MYSEVHEKEFIILKGMDSILERGSPLRASRLAAFGDTGPNYAKEGNAVRLSTKQIGCICHDRDDFRSGRLDRDYQEEEHITGVFNKVWR